MKKFIRSTAFKALVCVIAALIIGAVIAALTHNNSTPLSGATSTLLHPLQRVSAYVSYKISNFNDSFRSSSTLAEENKKLRAQVDDYRRMVVDYEETKRKLDTYEDFLGVKEDNPDFVFENATIIARDSTNPFESFTLNKGSSSGVSVNDPVIYGSNLVGVVTGVSPTTCTVSTIADPDMHAGIYEVYTGEVGYTNGSGDSLSKDYCILPGLRKDTAISPNGIVNTSGSGGVFPKDLTVGTVVELKDAKDGISKTAVIRSAIDISELSEVFIIKDFNGQGVVTVTEDKESAK